MRSERGSGGAPFGGVHPPRHRGGWFRQGDASAAGADGVVEGGAEQGRLDGDRGDRASQAADHVEAGPLDVGPGRTVATAEADRALQLSQQGVHLDVRPFGTRRVGWVDASLPGEASKYVDGWEDVLEPGEGWVGKTL